MQISYEGTGGNYSFNSYVFIGRIELFYHLLMTVIHDLTLEFLPLHHHSSSLYSLC